MIENRILSLRQILRDEGVDALLLWSLPNIRYVTGFTGSDAVVVVTAKSVFFLTDSRYVSQAQQQVRVDEIREYKVKTDGVGSLIAEIGCPRVGFEGEAVSVAIFNKLRSQSADNLAWVPLDERFSRLRGIKSLSELEFLENAAGLHQEALEEILPRIRPGVTERDVAFALEIALRRRGGEDRAFDFIVASGPRGALPHGVASDKQLASGELVTIDFGTRIGGYYSDETVTLALGEVDPKLRRIYDCVLEAHDRAIEAIRPGAELKVIDAVAREYIAECGYGDYFGHGLGHGVGLQVHEFPTLSPRSRDRVEEGMVFTVEPGIYVPDLGGVRIEDMVTATAGGSRRLTRISKEFRTLPFD
ncbi:M24 family metallopeptidase [Geoalkalibacter subterraneus]|uniref:Integrase n=1 Tax=Geoalkalibacter subterraneus TaxID=483547 RepID=A0A0B5FNA4_9BACT|nr:Xaa-Pro peptidase family protein [Geoalkalibacter subterraneus]AJF06064.1 integrase [Geoalkalibacter subterraneus]